MATWQKSPPALVEAFLAALAQEPRAERRQMFGYPCAFVNGHLAVGLHEQRLIARVPELAEQHPCVILGRRMRQYGALDSPLDADALLHWIRRAVAHTAGLPPKAPKAPKPAKPPKARGGVS